LPSGSKVTVYISYFFQTQTAIVSRGEGKSLSSGKNRPEKRLERV